MICTEAEYQATKKRAREQSHLIKQQEEKLAAEGLKPEQIKRALDPMRSFAAQVSEEIESYEQMKHDIFTGP